MSRNSRAKIEFSPWTAILLAAFIALTSPVVLGAVLFAAVCHELGHYLTLRSLGGRVEAIRIGILGAEIRLADRPTLSYGREMLAVAAGPCTNLALGLMLAWGGRDVSELYIFSGAHLVLGAFNLLPVRPLDGGTLIWLMLAWATDPFAADRCLRWIGVAVTVSLALFSLWLWVRAGSPFLFLAVIGLGRSLCPEKGLVKKGKRR